MPGPQGSLRPHVYITTNPAEIVEQQGLRQMTDASELGKLVAACWPIRCGRKPPQGKAQAIGFSSARPCANRRESRSQAGAGDHRGPGRWG